MKQIVRVSLFICHALFISVELFNYQFRSLKMGQNFIMYNCEMWLVLFHLRLIKSFVEPLNLPPIIVNRIAAEQRKRDKAHNKIGLYKT